MGQESQFQLSLCVCHFIKTQLNCLNTRTAGAEPTAVAASAVPPQQIRVIIYGQTLTAKFAKSCAKSNQLKRLNVNNPQQQRVASTDESRGKQTKPSPELAKVLWRGRMFLVA